MSESLQLGPEQSVLPQVGTPCLAKLDARPWHTTLAVRTGLWHIGVRVDTEETADQVRDVLGPVLAPSMDTSVYPNFSVELGSDDGRRRSLALVYRDHDIVARRYETDEVLKDLVILLDEMSRITSAEAPVLHTVAVSNAAGEATLVPAGLHRSLLTRRRQLERAGLTLSRGQAQTLDLSSGLLHERLVDDGLRAIASSRGIGQESRPVRLWCLPALGEEPFSVRPVEAVFMAFGTVLNRRAIGAGRLLSELSAPREGLRFLALPAQSSAGLATLVTELATP